MEDTISGNYPSNQNVTMDIPDISTVPTITLQDSQNTTPQIERDDKGQITKGIAQDTNKNGTAGRPCEYCKRKDEIMRITNDYIERSKNPKNGKVFVPFIEELALEIHTTDTSIINWAEKKAENGDHEHPEFFTAYSIIKMIQKLRLQQRALGRYQPMGALTLLRFNHGMMDASKQIIAGEKKEPLEIVIVEEKSLPD